MLVEKESKSTNARKLKKKPYSSDQLEDVFFNILKLHATDLICLHRQDDRTIVFASDSSFEMLGYKPEELLGNEVFFYIAEEFHADMAEELFRKMLYRPNTEIRLMLKSKSNEVVWVSSKWIENIEFPASEEKFAVSVNSNVTESVLLMEDLIRAWSKEKEVNELRSSLFAIASHEIKTPLAVIQMQTDILKKWAAQDKLDKKYLNVLDKFQNQVNRLDEIIGDIVRFRQINNGQEPFNTVQLNIVGLSKDVIEGFGDAYGKNRIALVIKGEERSFTGDRKMVQYMLSSLLDNAGKYSAKKDPVCLEIEYLSDELQIKVSDLGIGIPPHELKRIFEPFYRSENAVMNVEGTGVALAVIQEFVLLHKGKIFATSELGKGTTFHVNLPYYSDKPSTP